MKFATHRTSTRYGPRCLWNYLPRSASVLAHHPTAEAVTTKDFVQKSFDCARCLSRKRGDVLELSQIFGTEIENVIQRVSVLLWAQSYVGAAS